MVEKYIFYLVFYENRFYTITSIEPKTLKFLRPCYLKIKSNYAG